LTKALRFDIFFSPDALIGAVNKEKNDERKEIST